MARGTPFFYSGLVGGLNSRDSAFEVQDDQARDLLNVVANANGAITKRTGTASFATLAAAAKTLVGIESVGPKLLVQVGTKWYSTSGTSATDITGAATVTSGLPWAVAQFQTSLTGSQGPVYMMNGTDTPLYWTGTGNVASWTASSGTLPNGTSVVAAGNRLWVSGMATGTPSGTDPASTVVFSDLSTAGGARSWPTNNYVQVSPNDGDHIVALSVVDGFVVVFKRKSTWIIYDLNTGYVRQLSGQIGCCAARSIAPSPQGVFFLADDGVYVATSKTLDLISDIVRPTVAGIVPAQRANAAGIVFNNHYHLSYCSTGSANDMTLDFDMVLKSWWKHSVGAAQFAVWKASNTPELYGIPDASRVEKLYVANAYTDAAGGYQAYWTTNWQSPIYFRRRRLNAPDTKKRLRQIRVSGSGQFSVNVAVNFVGLTFQHVGDIGTSQTNRTFGGSDGTSFGPTDTGTFADTPSTTQSIFYGRGGANVALAFSYQFISPSTYSGSWQLETYETFVDPRTN